MEWNYLVLIFQILFGAAAGVAFAHWRIMKQMRKKWSALEQENSTLREQLMEREIFRREVDLPPTSDGPNYFNMWDEE